MALEIVLAVVAGLAVFVAVVAMMRGKSSGGAPEVAALRNDVNILRETNAKSIQLIAEQVRAIGGNVQTSLEAVRSDVGNRLDANASAMSQTSKTVSDRMANVQTAFASLQEQVGAM